MKRYILFAYHSYYPSGGWYDYQGSFDTIDEAISSVDESRIWYDHYEIVDSQIESIVSERTSTGWRTTKGDQP